MGGGGRGELLLLFFIGSWRGLADGGGGGGERGRGFMAGSGKETGGLTEIEATGAAGASAGLDLLIIAGGRGVGGLTGLAELRAKTESDLVSLLLAVALVLVLFGEVERGGSGTVVLMGLWLLVSRGAGIGGMDLVGGGESGDEGGTDFAGGGGGADFDGLGERASGGGGGLAGLGGVCDRCLCGLGSLDPRGLVFSAIELADPWALALTLALAL